MGFIFCLHVPTLAGLVPTLRWEHALVAPWGVVGHCFCVGYAPGMHWSPSGRLAVPTTGIPGFTAGGVFEVSTDGKLTNFGGGNGPIAWRLAP